MGIKNITTKKWKELKAENVQLKVDLDELRRAYKNLHELYKGIYQKSLTEKNELSDTIKHRDMEIEDMQKKLRKAEHEKAEALKRLKKYEPSRANKDVELHHPTF